MEKMMADEHEAASTNCEATRTGRRKLGLLRGKVWAARDAWDPDPELGRLFYEGDPNFRSALDEYLEELTARPKDNEDGGPKR
jgi:hypothetical protein